MGNNTFLDYLHLSKVPLRVIVILILAWLLMVMSRKLVRVFRNYLNARAGSAEEKRRIETLARVFRHTTTVVISLVAGMLALSELGISIAPILGAAGVVGIAVGFGAQSLIKDYFNGFFMLLENQIRQITIVTNKSRDYAFALIDVGVAYRENLDEVCEVAREVSRALRADAAIGPKIMEDIEIQGVQDWADSAVVLRCRFKTVALEQWNVRRAFLGRLKQAFDARGIEIPYPHLTIYP